MMFRCAISAVMLLAIAAIAPAQGTFSWDRLPPLPDELGVAGPFVGTPGGKTLLVAGGANFPRPVWDHPKAWHDVVWVMEPQGDGWSWRAAGRYRQRVVAIDDQEAPHHPVMSAQPGLAIPYFLEAIDLLDVRNKFYRRR